MMYRIQLPNHVFVRPRTQTKHKRLKFCFTMGCFRKWCKIRAKNATCNFAPVIWTEVVLILQSHPDRNDF